MEEEFDEEEVWAMVREIKDDNFNTRKFKGASFLTSTKSSASRKIPISNNTVGEDSSSAAMIHQSAPITIPNWFEMFEKGDKDDKDEEEEEDIVPPHVWIAKKMERTQISSFSVCEGKGRTLKGRDQRKVRDAVLARTGFLD